MKFLTKNLQSPIHTEGLTYQKNRSENNAVLRDRLIKEQKNFCAYTEKYIQGLDSVEVEHFDSSKKYQDDYFNYYAVLRKPNLYKRDEKFKNHTFFQTLFFHDKTAFDERIKYQNGIYCEVDEADEEARDLIDFLGFNHPELSKDRSNHLNRLKSIFPYLSDEQKLKHFEDHKEELSFITALEIEFGLDFSEILATL
jgi:hypothetical protein